MPRIFRKLAILHKIETVYGQAPTPAPAAVDAIIGKNVQFTPIESGEVSRDLLLPYLGNQGVILTGKHAKIEFDVELAGSGAAGTAPNARTATISDAIMIFFAFMKIHLPTNG